LVTKRRTDLPESRVPGLRHLDHGAVHRAFFCFRLAPESLEFQPRRHQVDDFASAPNLTSNAEQP
jgi:hypothetical protein